MVELNINFNPKPEDVERLVEIQYNFLNSEYNELIIYFNKTTFINAAVFVVLGTLCVYSNYINKTVKFKFKDEENSCIYKFMNQVGFYNFFMKSNCAIIGKNAIPFNCIANEDKMEEYTNKILELAPIIMEEEAKDILSSYFFEIYQNAFYHANSPIDVFSSGYWMPNKKSLIFSIYDMGIGIPKNVRTYLNKQMNSRECIEWALAEGMSTIEDKLIKRGLGLSRLEKFIKLNNGTISIYTDNICCTIDKNCRNFTELSTPIMGTLMIINIIADTEHIYIVS